MNDFKLKTMEDYNEKVDYGSGIVRDRLDVKSNIYGYNVWDRKLKQNIIFAKSKDICERGIRVLMKQPDRFEEYMDKIIDEVVTTNKVLVCNEKYDDTIYAVPTLEDLYKVSLRILKERLKVSYIFKYEMPIPIDYTFEDIKNTPKSLQKDALVILNEYNKLIKGYEENNFEYDQAKKAVKEKNGNLAWRILEDRCDHEYERVEIIDPITI